MKFLSLRHDFKKMEGLRIVLTYRCNYNCRFCYQKVKQGQTMPLDEFKVRLALIPKSYKPTYITLMGGEIATIWNFEEYLKVLKRKWPVIPISVTTNGSGSPEFYKRLFLIGVNNITFSLSTTDEQEYKKVVGLNVSVTEYMEKIKKVAQAGQVRVNSYIYPKNVSDIYLFCKENKLKLTFCEELKKENQHVFREINRISNLKCVRKSKFEIVYQDTGGFEFWNYLHQDSYDYNNLIMLPNGSFTDDFGDVVKQKGNRTVRTESIA